MNYTIKEPLETKPELDPYHADTGGISKTELKIDECGNVYAIQEYQDGSTPLDEWNSRTLTFCLEHVKESDLRELLEDNPLIDRIVLGHSVEWNGNNLTGRLTADALNAIEKFQEELDNLRAHYDLWTAENWLNNNTPEEIGISATSSDAEIAALAKYIQRDGESEIMDGFCVLIDLADIIKYLTDLRDSLLGDD